MDRLSPAQLASWCAEHGQAGRGARVLDVRETWEVQLAQVQPEGFELLHIPMSRLGAEWGNLEPEVPIACLCHHGVRSLQVANFLATRGFAHVANIEGGIDAWSASVDPRVPRY
ncbi:MAG TPA: rhodanese-like domain-containing protein [Burkholderiaceae bacterium]|jgi:rhodanese-related sulfurtransferase|nr:rhodanese-like domain-containing protein [Burkholderiaceae bacterium]